MSSGTKIKKMKKINYLFSLMTILAAFTLCLTISCSKEEVNLESEKPVDSEMLFSKLAKEDINKKELSNILLKISIDNQMVNDVHSYVKESLEYGLDETVFIDEIVNPEKYNLQLSSTSRLSNQLRNAVQSSEKISTRNMDEDMFLINGLEIYWPYSEDWDGQSIPMITYCPSNGEYIDEDKLMAYKYTPLDDENYKIDSLLINEEYVMKNPVWVINTKSIEEHELIKLKKNKDFSKFYPRNEKLMTINNSYLKPTPSVRSTPFYKIAETTVTSIKSEKQHDDWANGGSEYIIYWFFPVSNFGLSQHCTQQIKLSRKEISRATTRNINFIGNFDWDKGQTHNRIKIIEFDPGNNTKYKIEFSTTYKPKDSEHSVTGKFSTEIEINKPDDHIMELTIPRTVMFTHQTKVNDNLYKKSFTENGVTVNVNISGIEGLEF